MILRNGTLMAKSTNYSQNTH